MQSDVDKVASRVDRLTISRKPKRRGPPKSEIEAMNREDIKEFNVNREYILHNQPFAPGTFPPQYVPHRPTKWYPPMFCLGVALSTKETKDFARHLGLTVDERGSMVAYGIAGHLTRVCGADPQVTLQRCDRGGPFGDWVWVFSLLTNYHTPDKIHGKGSLDKYREIVEGAFGSSKQVMWWLEYSINHTPTDWWWSGRDPGWIDKWDPERVLG